LIRLLIALVMVAFTACTVEVEIDTGDTNFTTDADPRNDAQLFPDGGTPPPPDAEPFPDGGPANDAQSGQDAL
jgi:hypothetical protein